MIRFPPYDGEGTIELLDEEETDHLMGESHLGKGDLLLCSIIDALRETVGTTYQENETLGDGLEALLHPLTELATGHLAATFIEKDKDIAWLQTVEHLIGLAFLLLLFAQGLGVLEVGYLLEGSGEVMCEALDVLVDERRENIAGSATGEEDMEFHWGFFSGRNTPAIY